MEVDDRAELDVNRCLSINGRKWSILWFALQVSNSSMTLSISLLLSNGCEVILPTRALLGALQMFCVTIFIEIKLLQYFLGTGWHVTFCCV